ncbi:MAG: HPr(Ser) kinase/phosphatase [Pseudomonadota bacterium]
MLSIPVSSLLQAGKLHMHLTLLAGKRGLTKRIHIPRIQKPGLALVGNISNLHPGRIQVLGKSEINFLNSLSLEERKKIFTAMCQIDIASFVITRDNDPPQPLKKICEQFNVPLLKTHLLTSTFVNRCAQFLDEHLTATTTIHGVLLDVFGIGVLLVGHSGIGKSECALELILRGHRLVADDIVNVKRHPPSTLYGSGSEIIRYHMEIRGLGIINIRDLFGISAVRDRKLIELVIELTDWNPSIEYDRLGVEDSNYTMLDVALPFVQIPVRPGRNIAAIIEIASRNQLLKQEGHHSAREFQEKLDSMILSRASKDVTTREEVE